MRILQIVHDFLPRHLAGVEVYTDAISRHLATAHDVAILYTEVLPELDNYSLRRFHRGDVRLYELVNNHIYETFEETYLNPRVDRRVLEVLDDFRPDVIHIQHLLHLSIRLVAEASRRGIPTVMTLHDHWLACARGGQRFHRRLGRCDVLDAARCGPCVAGLQGLRAENGSLGGSPSARGGATVDTLSLAERSPDEQEAPEASYIYRDRYQLGDALSPTWVAHPPARLVFEIQDREVSAFEAAIGLHPRTFDCEGGGVRFSVAVDGVERFAKYLDPKRRPEHRVPFPVRVGIRPGESRIELRTAAVPAEDNSYCTAGWIHPRFEKVAGGGPSLLARTARRFGSWQTRSTRQRRVRERWRAVRRMAESVDLFLAPSRYLREEFVAFGFDPDKIAYSDYGFLVDRFERREDLPAVARRFAFIGSPVRHKGLHVLLDAFRALPPDAELRVCGSLDYEPEYVAEIRARPQHPGVRFLGSLANDRVPEFLATVDCLVVPSIWGENSPLTIHEAFMAGVPVVASRLGGHEELLSEGGGLLYASDDVEDLAAQLLRLYREEGLLRELATTSFPVKSMAEHIEELTGIYGWLLARSFRAPAAAGTELRV